MDEVGVPQKIADNMTVTETINAINIEHFQKLVNQRSEKIKYVIEPPNQKIILAKRRGNITLDYGWKIERSLKDGDLVLFNRQPSLHKMSIMCHKVKVMPGSTFRLNLSCTTPYNADFDGDEMNMHVLQTPEARAEAMELMSVAKNIITPQSHRPVMGIVQDSLVASYVMTSKNTFMDFDDFCQYTFDYGVPIPAIVHPKPLWTGTQCFSTLFPKEFHYDHKGVKVVSGDLVSGQMSKKVLGRSDGSIIHILFNDCGADKTIHFMNSLQRMMNNWFCSHGFSIGIEDMLTSSETAEKIKNVFEKTLTTCTSLQEDEHYENNMNRILNSARDSMGLVALKEISPSNRLFQMVNSGSKGSSVNILQIMAAVGQQNCQGQRPARTMDGRCLPMFHKNDKHPRAHGFVQHSYMKGLNAAEFFFHAIGGREGLVDTAVKTSQTGYVQHRLIKALESLKVVSDYSVREDNGRIIQFKYGDDAVDGTKMEMVHIDFHTIDAHTFDQRYKHSIYYQHLQEYKILFDKDKNKYAMPIPLQRIAQRYSYNSPGTNNIFDSLLDIIDNRKTKAYVMAELSKPIYQKMEKSDFNAF